MVKAKVFWDFLCGKLDYRFFAGVPCKGLKPLYDEMSSKFMHYIPAVNEKIALGLVNGAWLAGVKGAILMDSKNLLDITNLLLSFNNKYKVPTLIICYGTPDRSFLLLDNFIIANISDGGDVFENNLTKIIDKIEKEKKPGMFFIGKGDLK